MKKGDKYGAHRVIEPKGVLPQAADRIDNSMEIYDNEILVSVKTLNVDSASFTQIEEEAGHDTEEIGEIIMDTVKTQGQTAQPGYRLGGDVHGDDRGRSARRSKDTVTIKPGDFIASLVSLSTTPLVIEKIVEIRPDRDQVDIVGKAILFESGIYVKLPDDMPQSVSLAVLDVAGAAAQTAKLVKPGDIVFIIGAGGKSGMLCAYEAKRRAGVTGIVIGTGHSRREHQTDQGTRLLRPRYPGQRHRSPGGGAGGKHADRRPDGRCHH